MPRAVIGILRHEPGQLGEGLKVHFQVSQDKPLKKWTTGQKPKNTLYVPPWKVSRIPKSEKFLLVKSGTMGFGIRNSAQAIRNSANDKNLESEFH